MQNHSVYNGSFYLNFTITLRRHTQSTEDRSHYVKAVISNGCKTKMAELKLVRGEMLNRGVDSKNKNHSSALMIRLYYKTNVPGSGTGCVDILYWGKNGMTEIFEHVRERLGGLAASWTIIYCGARFEYDGGDQSVHEFFGGRVQREATLHLFRANGSSDPAWEEAHPEQAARLDAARVQAEAEREQRRLQAVEDELDPEGAARRLEAEKEAEAARCVLEEADRKLERERQQERGRLYVEKLLADKKAEREGRMTAAEQERRDAWKVAREVERAELARNLARVRAAEAEAAAAAEAAAKAAEAEAAEAAAEAEQARIREVHQAAVEEVAAAAALGEMDVDPEAWEPSEDEGEEEEGGGQRAADEEAMAARSEEERAADEREMMAAVAALAVAAEVRKAGDAIDAGLRKVMLAQLSAEQADRRLPVALGGPALEAARAKSKAEAEARFQVELHVQCLLSTAPDGQEAEREWWAARGFNVDKLIEAKIARAFPTPVSRDETQRAAEAAAAESVAAQAAAWSAHWEAEAARRAVKTEAQEREEVVKKMVSALAGINARAAAAMRGAQPPSVSEESERAALEVQAWWDEACEEFGPELVRRTWRIEEGESAEPFLARTVDRLTERAAERKKEEVEKLRAAEEAVEGGLLQLMLRRLSQETHTEVLNESRRSMCAETRAAADAEAREREHKVTRHVECLLTTPAALQEAEREWWAMKGLDVDKLIDATIRRAERLGRAVPAAEERKVLSEVPAQGVSAAAKAEFRRRGVINKKRAEEKEKEGRRERMVSACRARGAEKFRMGVLVRRDRVGRARRE